MVPSVDDYDDREDDNVDKIILPKFSRIIIRLQREDFVFPITARATRSSWVYYYIFQGISS